MKRFYQFLGACVGLLIVIGLGLVLAGDHEAEAARPRHIVWITASGQTASAGVGATTFGRTWDWYVSADTISASTDAGAPGIWPYEPDGGTLTAGHTDGGLSTGYQSSSGFTSTGIGQRLVNQGISLNGANWRRTSSINLPGYSGNGYRSLTRIIFVHEAGASGTAGVLASIGRSGVGSFQIWAQSTTSFRVILNAATGGTYSSIVTAPQGISVGPHVLDVFTSDSENTGANERLNAAFYFDGLLAAGVEHTSDQSAWTGNLTDQISIGATAAGATPVLGRTVFFVGQVTGSNASWYKGLETSYTDCVADGLCPNMGSGASRGTGRGLLQGDGGILNIVQPSSFFADGRTRTGLGVVWPAVYNPSVPADLYLHLCGCTWTGATCRGSFVGGSAATADPNMETGDPNGIHAYLNAQYADPTDCAGGVGWVKGNTSGSDYQLNYVDAVVAYMRANYAVRATWIVGRSNGAGFAHWYAAMRPTLVSGVADTIGYWPGAGNGGGGQMTSTAAVGRNPVYAMHNQDDPTVRVDFARIMIPNYLDRNLGIDAGSSDGSVGTCVGLDSGGIDGSQLLTGCGCGSTQGTYDGGPNGVCCTWPASAANTAALDGGIAYPFMYCESRSGGHLPPPGEGERIRTFLLNYGEDAGG